MLMAGSEITAEPFANRPLHIVSQYNNSVYSSEVTAVETFVRKTVKVELLFSLGMGLA